MDPTRNTPPRDPLEHPRIPKEIRFVVHVKTWRLGTLLASDVQPKVLRVKTTSEMGSLSIARYTLHLTDVLGLRWHPDPAIWKMADAHHQLGHPDAIEPRRDGTKAQQPPDVLPTLVCCVPESLNPDYQEAIVPFGPSTMSWLHQGAESPRNLASRPRVIVPLHLSHREAVHKQHQRRPASARAGAAAAGGSLGTRMSAMVPASGHRPAPARVAPYHHRRAPPAPPPGPSSSTTTAAAPSRSLPSSPRGEPPRGEHAAPRRRLSVPYSHIGKWM